MNVPARTKSGFALVEAILASAIGAAAATSFAMSIAIAVRSMERLMETNEIIQEAENLAARIQSGAPIEGFIASGRWRVQSRELEDRSNGVMRLEAITVTHMRRTSFAFTVVTVAPDENA